MVALVLSSALSMRAGTKLHMSRMRASAPDDASSSSGGGSAMSVACRPMDRLADSAGLAWPWRRLRDVGLPVTGLTEFETPTMTPW